MTNQASPPAAPGPAAPDVTVLMRAYNAERYLREAVDSVLAQTYADFELLVLDDGSTDGTAAILASYDDPRLRVVRQTNSGYLEAAVRALREARGTYVAVLDSDDRSRPDRLERQLEAFRRDPALVVVASTVRIIDAGGRVIGERRFPRDDRAIRRAMPLYNCICHSAAMYRREPALAVGGYAPGITIEDYDLWLRLLRVGTGLTLDEALVDYRLKGGPLNGSHLKFVLKGTLQSRSLAFRKYGYARTLRTRLIDIGMSMLVWLPAGVIDRGFRLAFYRRRKEGA